jgi:hypothetical protein
MLTIIFHISSSVKIILGIPFEIGYFLPQFGQINVPSTIWVFLYNLDQYFTSYNIL